MAKTEVSVEMVDKWIDCMKKGKAAMTTFREYRDVRNRLFTCLEVGKMETNYPAIKLYVSSTNMSCFYFLWRLCSIYQRNAGHDAVSIYRSINLTIDYFINRLIDFNRLIVAALFRTAFTEKSETAIADSPSQWSTKRKSDTYALLYGIISTDIRPTD